MLRLTRIGLAVLVTILCAGCTTKRSTPQPPPATINPVRYILPNGIPVIIQEHRASDVVALQLWVRAGGRDEASDELGLAHYLEHMLFKGTIDAAAGLRRARGRSGRRPDQCGDVVGLHLLSHGAAGPARDRGHRDARRRRVNASLDAKLLEAEKQVVLEEMRLNEDNPRRFLVRQLFGSAFEGHPYGRPVIGTPRADPRAQPRDAGRLLPPALRPRALHPRGGRRREARGGAAGGARDAGRAAARGGARRLPPPPRARPASRAVRSHSARRAGLPGHGVASRRGSITPTRRRSIC